MEAVAWVRKANLTISLRYDGDSGKISIFCNDEIKKNNKNLKALIDMNNKLF